MDATEGGDISCEDGIKCRVAFRRSRASGGRTIAQQNAELTLVDRDRLLFRPEAVAAGRGVINPEDDLAVQRAGRTDQRAGGVGDDALVIDGGRNVRIKRSTGEEQEGEVAGRLFHGVGELGMRV